MTATNELQKVLNGYEVDFDEPAALDFLVALRKEGVLHDRNWGRILQWLGEAMQEFDRTAREGRGALDIDADPRYDDWIRIVGARRRAGYRVPSWAALWLWRIGFEEEDATAFWQQVNRVAGKMGFRVFV